MFPFLLTLVQLLQEFGEELWSITHFCFTDCSVWLASQIHWIFFCFLSRCQNQNMNSEYQVLCTYPHSCANVVVWIKKKSIYHTECSVSRLPKLSLASCIFHFLLPFQWYWPLWKDILDHSLSPLGFGLHAWWLSLEAINLYMATIWTGDNSIQAMMAVVVGMRWGTMFWLCSVRMLTSFSCEIVRNTETEESKHSGKRGMNEN